MKCLARLTTIYLDMRDQGDPDTHIQNVAMTKPVNEAYWTSGTYASTAFPVLLDCGTFGTTRHKDTQCRRHPIIFHHPLNPN